MGFKYLSFDLLTKLDNPSISAPGFLSSILECIHQDRVIPSWMIGPRPVGQNDIFKLKPKYYDKAENRKAEITIRSKIVIVIALLFTVYYMT